MSRPTLTPPIRPSFRPSSRRPRPNPHTCQSPRPGTRTGHVCALVRPQPPDAPPCLSRWSGRPAFSSRPSWRRAACGAHDARTCSGPLDRSQVRGHLLTSRHPTRSYQSQIDWILKSGARSTLSCAGIEAARGCRMSRGGHNGGTYRTTSCSVASGGVEGANERANNTAKLVRDRPPRHARRDQKAEQQKPAPILSLQQNSVQNHRPVETTTHLPASKYALTGPQGLSTMPAAPTFCDG